MKQNLFLLLCLTDIVSITSQLEYTLVTTPKTWGDAKMYCQDMYEGLATVQMDSEWKKLNDEAATKGLPPTGWVGLYDRNNSWYWSYNGQGLNYSATFWGPGQPDNAGSNQFCTAINSDGYWEDYNCEESKPFICYNATVGELVAVPYPNSWGASRTYCRTYHTELANATDNAQNSELQQLALKQNTSWIGLSRFGWAWVAGYGPWRLLWAPGFPNNIEPDSYCASANNSLLMDRPCNSQFYFFCQINYLMRKRVLKLKIQADKSVFDPTVQSAILQKLVQTMNKHGISKDLTVKWKVYPDGTIFQKPQK